MADTIKDYLISLGFSVDNASYGKMRKILDDLGNKVQEKSELMSSSQIKAGSIIISSLVAIGAATTELMSKVAAADMGYQKFAMRMFMNKDAAKQYKIAIDALGEAPEDIAWIPELRDQYQKLILQARRMELAGGDKERAEEQLKYVRSIKFEFARLKLETTYGLSRVVFNLFSQLQTSIFGTKATFKDFNDLVEKKFPEWSEKIAFWLAKVVRVIYNTTKAVQNLITILYKGISVLPAIGQALLAFGAILTAIFVAGPLGKAILILSSLIYLIDDFYSYINGDKSNLQLSPIWDFLLEYTQKIKKGIVAMTFVLAEFYNLLEGKRSMNPVDIAKRLREGIDAYDKENPVVTKETIKASIEKKKEDKRKAAEDPLGISSLSPSRRALLDVESGGKVDRVNVEGELITKGRYRGQRAKGIAQIMPGNWYGDPRRGIKGWAEEAGLPKDAEWTLENQLKVYNHRMNILEKKFGEAGAAVEWKAGAGQLWLDNPDKAKQIKDQYAKDTVGKYLNKWDARKKHYEEQDAKKEKEAKVAIVTKPTATIIAAASAEKKSSKDMPFGFGWLINRKEKLELERKRLQAVADGNIAEEKRIAAIQKNRAIEEFKIKEARANDLKGWLNSDEVWPLPPSLSKSKKKEENKLAGESKAKGFISDLKEAVSVFKSPKQIEKNLLVDIRQQTKELQEHIKTNGNINYKNSRPEASPIASQISNSNTNSIVNNNSVTVNIDGPTTEEHVREIERVVRQTQEAYSKRQTLLNNRYPVLSGVAQ